MPALDPSQYLPGMLVFCHSAGIIGRLIRFGQHLRRYKNWELNHVAILDAWDPIKKDWTVIQAEAKGVLAGAYLSDITPGGYFKVVDLPAGIDRGKFLGFIRDQVGDKYSFLTDIVIGINILTPKWFRFDFHHPGTWICSGVAAGGLYYCGWPPLETIADIYQVMPSELDDLLTQSAASAFRKGK